MSQRALYVCGSVNQCEQMLAVSRALPEFEPAFTPYFGDGLIGFIQKLNLTEMSIAGKKRSAWTRAWLKERGLPVDERARGGPYDLIVDCSDVLMPRALLGPPMVVVQEGALDPEDWLYRICRTLSHFLPPDRVPRWVGGTNMTGLSFAYDRICVMSEGFKAHLMERGVPPERIAVTGVPNFDDCAKWRQNSFPLRGYVLVCTSDARETLKKDDRAAFLRKVNELAAGRPLVFKLHPNEYKVRARREIARHCPGAQIFETGCAEEMIANCDVLITQWSSTVFVGLALGKEVHTLFGEEAVRRLAPLQNGGRSAQEIARVCREVVAERAASALRDPDGSTLPPAQQRVRRPVPWVPVQPAGAVPAIAKEAR